MATVQTIEDGYRNLVIKVDGTGTETNTKIVDVSALNPPCQAVKLLEAISSIQYNAGLQLLWDATTPNVLFNLHGGITRLDFEETMGITNNAGVGKTGDVLLNGGVASTPYSLYLRFIKEGV